MGLLATAGGFLASNAATVASVAGTGLAAYGQYAAGREQQKAAEYNARMQEQEAARATEVGLENTRRKRRDNQRRLASFRAQFARAGVQSEGSYTDFMSGSASDLELQALDIFNQAENTAASLTNRALATRYSGQAASKAGMTGSVGTLLGGLSDSYHQHVRLKRERTPGYNPY